MADSLSNVNFIQIRFQEGINLFMVQERVGIPIGPREKAAVKFVRRLNKREEGSGRYRLPSEAEWEYATRAGTATVYSFGDRTGSLGDYAWYLDNTWNVWEKYAHPVGLKRANPFGLYDMHGNVSEWCEDWANFMHGVETDTYRDGIVDPISGKGSSRVFRGGSWHSGEPRCRSANRHCELPGFRNDSLGFRLVMIAVSKA